MPAEEITITMQDEVIFSQVICINQGEQHSMDKFLEFSDSVEEAKRRLGPQIV